MVGAAFEMNGYLGSVTATDCNGRSFGWRTLPIASIPKVWSPKVALSGIQGQASSSV